MRALSELFRRTFQRPIPPEAHAIVRPEPSATSRDVDAIEPAKGTLLPRTPSGRPTRAVPVALLGHGALYLSPSGHFVTEPSLDVPRSAVELGTALVRAGRFVEDGENLFSAAGLTTGDKARALASLVGAFHGASDGVRAVRGYESADQRLQVRAVIGPLVLDLVRSLDTRVPAEAELRDRALGELLRLVRAETHGVNRNFMVHDLDRVKEELPLEIRREVERMMGEIDPVRPPYEAWFGDGPAKLTVEYHAAPGFFAEDLAAYRAAGFEVRDEQPGRATLAKTWVVGGVPTEVVLRMIEGADRLFARMSDPMLHVVAYSGHASYGRPVRARLADGAPQAGKKLFIGLQCGGKSVHNELLGKYPELQIVQSRNASYGDEDRTLFLTVLDGIARRATWPEMAEANRKKNADNYYFPSDTLIRKRAEDLDGDGVADVWDRVVSYDAFHPDAEIAEQLAPKPCDADIHALDGRALHAALALFGRLAAKNEWAEELQDQRFLGGGFFAGGPKDTIFRIRPFEAGDGVPMYRVEVNTAYAHATEATLGAALCFTLGRFTAERAGRAKVEATASALLLAAKFLDVDGGPLAKEIWRALLAHEEVPCPLGLADVLAIAATDRDLPAGSRASVETLIQRAPGLA